MDTKKWVSFIFLTGLIYSSHASSSQVCEYLQQFELEKLEYLEYLDSGEIITALIRTPSSEIIKVQRGNYLGRDDGQIVEIQKTHLKIIEIVPDTKNGEGYREAPNYLPRVDYDGDSYHTIIRSKDHKPNYCIEYAK